MIGEIITDGGGGITTLVPQAEEDVNARLYWAGCGGLVVKVGDCLSADGIILIVEGEEILSGPEEILGGSIPGEEEIPTKNTISVRGRNWTVRRCLVHFVYSQDHR